MLKLAALGALGYAAWRYIQKHQADTAPRLNPVAGGPISGDARVQPAPVPTL